MVDYQDTFTIEGDIVFKRYMPENISVNFTTNLTSDNVRYIEMYYGSTLIDGFMKTSIENNDVFEIDPFSYTDKVTWTGINKKLRLVSYNSNYENLADQYFDVSEEKGTLMESAEYISNKLANTLTSKGITSSYYEGFSSLVDKVRNFEHFVWNGKTYPLIYGYDLTYNNGEFGGSNQIGYIEDGFFNGLNDWELSMTLTTSTTNGGFCLFAYNYHYNYCMNETTCTEPNKWDCILKNGRSDILIFSDGDIKINSGSSLVSTGIHYTQNATMDVMFAKRGTDIEYYENDVLKGSYTWNILDTAQKIYPGLITWDSESVNKFSNISLDRMKPPKTLFHDECSSSENLLYYDDAIGLAGLYGKPTFTYNQQTNSYEIYVRTQANQLVYPIKKLDGKDNFELSCEMKYSNTSYELMAGFAVIPNVLPSPHPTDPYIPTIGSFIDSNESITNSVVIRSGPYNRTLVSNQYPRTGNEWFKLIVSFENSNYSVRWEELDGTVMCSYDGSIDISVPTRRYCIYCSGNPNTDYLIRNINAERLD